MRLVPLADLLDQADAGYWGVDPGEADRDVRVIRNGDVGAEGTVRWERLPVRSLTEREVARARVQRGDIVLTTSGECGQAAYIDRTHPDGLCVTNFVRALRPRRESVEPRYLFWVINSKRFRDGLRPYIRGTTMQNLAFTAAAAAIKVPLPSLDEQRRIAAVLDRADALRARRSHTTVLVDELIGATFTQTFVQERAKQSEAIGSLAARTPHSVRTGPFGSQLLHSEFVDEGIAVLGIDNAVTNRFAWGRPRFITPSKFEQLRRYEVRPGDVLVTIMATCGRVAVVPDDIPLAINTKHLCCITLDRERCLPSYLWAAFRFDPSLRRQLGATARGAVMPGLNMTLIKEATVSLPPIDDQRRFDDFLRAAETHRRRLETSSSCLDSLFAALQQDVFRGQQ